MKRNRKLTSGIAYIKLPIGLVIADPPPPPPPPPPPLLESPGDVVVRKRSVDVARIVRWICKVL